MQYKIDGLDRETGEERSITLEASSWDAAVDLASYEGIVIPETPNRPKESPANNKNHNYKVYWSINDEKNMVEYPCSKCNHTLLSPLTSAGQHDNCPACHNGYIIPGEAELKRHMRSVEEKEEDNALNRLPKMSATPGCIIWMILGVLQFLGGVFTIGGASRVDEAVTSTAFLLSGCACFVIAYLSDIANQIRQLRIDDKRRQRGD